MSSTNHKRTILIQIDSDPHPSVFDRVVAVDSGIDEVFAYGGVTPEMVRELVHGAIFTRGPKDLKSTALFIGGSDVGRSEELFEEAKKHLLPDFGLRVSILFDANGCNTTAVAAVRAASNHLSFTATKALVLGGTGPVGQRVALLLARAGAEVRLASRRMDRAEQAVERIREKVKSARLSPVAVGDEKELVSALEGRQLVVAAGAAGVTLLPEPARKAASSLEVLIDLNAVPPLGVEGVEPSDRGAVKDGIDCYGALGVGAFKMKVHKAAVAALFERNDRILDAEEVYSIAQSL